MDLAHVIPSISSADLLPVPVAHFAVAWDGLAGDVADPPVCLDTKLQAGAVLKPVTAAGGMRTHEPDTSPEPFLLLSMFSRLLPVICIAQKTVPKIQYHLERSI